MINALSEGEITEMILYPLFKKKKISPSTCLDITRFENNKTNMISNFFIPNFCTTSARRSKSRNQQKVENRARSF